MEGASLASHYILLKYSIGQNNTCPTRKGPFDSCKPIRHQLEEELFLVTYSYIHSKVSGVNLAIFFFLSYAKHRYVLNFSLSSFISGITSDDRFYTMEVQ